MKRLNLAILLIMMVLTLTYQTPFTQQTEERVAEGVDLADKKVNYLKPKLESFNLIDSIKHYKFLVDTLKDKTRDDLIVLKKQQAKLEDVIDTARTIQLLSSY